MTLWLVRAGERGEREDFALEEGLAVIGWDELPDLSNIQSRASLKDIMRQRYPDAGEGRITNHTGQLWAFTNRMKQGDHVVLPLKSRAQIAVGVVEGPYTYDEVAHDGTLHRRKVKWLKKDLPRGRLDQDILYSLGAFLTVCQIKRNDAEKRILAAVTGQAPSTVDEEDVDEADAPADLAQLALDQVRQAVQRRFKGHAMEALVAALLRAQGYTVHKNRKGRDGGLDLLAGSGPLGLDSPKLVVQVKSGEGPTDAKEVREFRTVVTDYEADAGLFIAWGGFKGSIFDERKKSFFQVRYWDSDDLLRAIFLHYDALPEDVKAELPLQRIWALVPEDEA